MSLRVGILVNPIAGLGGRGGYKGSDLDWQAALDAGYEPQAQERGQRFVAAAEEATRDPIDWLTVPGAMGVPGVPTIEAPNKTVGDTTPQDTQEQAKALRDAGIDLLCFVGGDGTATDVARAVGDSVPCLGIPAGVKITSPVFGHDPEEAGYLVAHLAPGFETVARDVTDLDEEAYRQGRLDTHLTGSLAVPLSPFVQGGKVATTQETPLEPLVDQVLENWDPDALWLVGAGSVCMAVKKRFWGEPTLLGVDAIVGDKIIATDLNDRDLEALLADHEGRPARLLLSVIGGQGMLLGRGTQVFTPTVLRRIGWDNIVIAAPPEKLLGLSALHVDSGDPDWDAEAPKYLRVISGWHETRMVRVHHGAA